MHSLGSIYRGLRGLRPYVTPYRAECLVGIVAMFCNVLLLLPIPMLTKLLIDEKIPGGDAHGVIVICLLSGLILVLSNASAFFQRYYIGRFELHVFRDIQSKLLQKLLRVDPSYRHSKQTGYLLSRITDDTGRLRSLFTDIIASLTKDVLIFLVGIFLLYYLDWRLATVSLLALPFFIVVLNFYNLRVRRASMTLFERNAQYVKKLEESIQLSDTIIALGAQHYDLNKVRNRQEQLVKAGVSKNVVDGAAKAVISIIGGLSPLLVIGIGAHFIFQGSFTLGGLIAFNAVIGYVFGPSSRLVGSLLEMQQGVVAWERVQEVLQLPDYVKEFDSKSTPNFRSEGPIALELKHVAVQYGDKVAVSDVSIKVPEGSFTALVGESGSGKSTLLRAILGTHAVSSGEILYNDQPMMAGEQLSAFRVAILAQEPALFATTIRDNICMGRGDDDVLEQAAEEAGIAQFVQSLPCGYETQVNERGVNLSVGQKQRVALARCLAMKPNLLLLDEPTANLDVGSESALWTSMRPVMRRTTTIVAAHRLHTIVEADCIYVLSQGRIVEHGTHAELLRKHGFYHRLWSVYS